MALFGRPSPQDQRRAEAWREWIARRDPLAIASLVLGVFSLIEFGALLVFGVAGIVLGTLALRRMRFGLEGKRLAWTGILLSALSLVVAGVIYTLPLWR